MFPARQLFLSCMFWKVNTCLRKKFYLIVMHYTELISARLFEVTTNKKLKKS
jgi:hypothetical protein